jgi:hypothetical protein
MEQLLGDDSLKGTALRESVQAADAWASESGVGCGGERVVHHPLPVSARIKDGVEVWRRVQVESEIAPAVDEMWREAERMVIVAAEDAAADPSVGDEDEVAKRLDERPLPADALVKLLRGEGGSHEFEGGRPCRLEAEPCVGKAGKVVGEYAGAVKCSSLPSG